MTSRKQENKIEGFEEGIVKRVMNQCLVFILKFISLFPFWMIYTLSDISYILVRYIIKYRKKVILNNLQRSFPEKDEAEIKQIMGNYYRYFCDFMLETVKLHGMSKQQFSERFVIKGADKMNAIADKGLSTIMLGMHYCNWEWSCFLQEKMKHRFLVVYNPVRGNLAMERFVLSSRERWGGKLVPVHKSGRVLFEYMKKQEHSALGLIADQASPANSPFWTVFLNQEAPFFSGPGKIAKKTNQPVSFLHIKRVKRGYYEANISILIEEPGKLDANEILLRYVRKAEEIIRENPEYYLWSHRRWKHTRPEGIELTV